MANDGAEFSEPVVDTILNPAEAAALDHARLVATAESLQNVANILGGLGLNQEAIVNLTGSLRDQLTELPNRDIQKFAKRSAKMAGSLATNSVGVQKPVPHEPESQAEVPEVRVSQPIEKPHKEAAQTAIAQQPGAGVSQLERAFRGILSKEEAAQLQTLSPVQQELFLGSMKDICQRTVRKKGSQSSLDLQINRIGLFMKARTAPQVAAELGESRLATNSGPNGIRVFLVRDRQAVREAFAHASGADAAKVPTASPEAVLSPPALESSKNLPQTERSASEPGIAKAEKADKKPKGLAELERAFRGILNSEELAVLQGLGVEKQANFIARLEQRYRANSSKPSLAPTQVERILLYMKGHSRGEVAYELDQNRSALDQSLISVNKIFERVAEGIREDFARLQQPEGVQPAPEETAADVVLESTEALEQPVEKELALVGNQELDEPAPVRAERALSEEPMYVQVADRLIESLEIESEYQEALRGMLNPTNGGTMSANKHALAQRVRDYLVARWSNIDNPELDLSGLEQAMLRKFTGVFGQGVRVQFRPPLQLSDINAFAGNQLQKGKNAEALHSGLIKAFRASETVAAVSSDEQLTPEDIITRAAMGEVILRESWLEAAEIITKRLGKELSLNQEEIQALWQRAHRNGTDIHIQKSSELVSALSQLQPILIYLRSDLEKLDRPVFAEAGKFTANVFGGPYDLDQIDSMVPNADAEKHIMLAFTRVLKYLQHEKS